MISDKSASNSAKPESSDIRLYDYEYDEDEGDDSKCDWDIEIIQFVVESFISIFPEKGDTCARRRVRHDSGSRELLARSQMSSLSSTSSHCKHNDHRPKRRLY